MAGKEVLVSALAGCSSRALVEDTFSRFQVTDLSARTQYMNECMGNPKTFFCSGSDNVQKKYEATLQMLIAGHWKLINSYKALNGLSK